MGRTYNGVTCDSGYFSVNLDGVSQGIFSGADRWIEVEIGGQVLSPRLKVGSFPTLTGVIRRIIP